MFRPIRNFVLFAAVDYEDVSKGGIIAPGDYKASNGPGADTVAKPKRAKVIATGPGKHFTTGSFRETFVKSGDYCQLTPNAYIMTMMLNGEIVYMTEDEYLCGTFDEGDFALQVVQGEKKEEKPRIQVLS